MEALLRYSQCTILGVLVQKSWGTGPLVGECGVAKPISKLELRFTSVELVGSTRRCPHGHVEERDLINVFFWILCKDNLGNLDIVSISFVLPW